jgi:hypothetical protein
MDLIDLTALPIGLIDLNGGLHRSHTFRPWISGPVRAINGRRSRSIRGLRKPYKHQNSIAKKIAVGYRMRGSGPAPPDNTGPVYWRSARSAHLRACTP